MCLSIEQCVVVVLGKEEFERIRTDGEMDGTWVWTLDLNKVG